MVSRRWPHLILLLIISIILINALQFFWLRNSYQITKNQYKEIINRSLYEACADYTAEKIRKYKKVEGKRFFSITLSPNQKIKSPSGVNKSAIDSILPKGYQSLLQVEKSNPFLFDHALFESFLIKRIESKGIAAIVRIDTFHLKNLEEKILKPRRNSPSGFSFQTEAAQLNLFSPIAVVASCHISSSFFFKEMLLLIIFSMLVFILGNVLLMATFKRLSKQKKLQSIKDDFISNMTHELKTPISIVSSAIDTLLNHGGMENKEKTQKYLSTSKRELEHLDTLVDKLMNAAIENESLSTVKELADVEDIIRNIIQKNQVLYENCFEIRFDVVENKKNIYINKVHFANAINNIVDNALKYGGTNVSITIKLMVTYTTCNITIADNGIGIPNKYHDMIFEKFFRVPTKAYKKGHGLGLFYVKQVIENHNGTIHLKSGEGTGTQFTIILPIDIA